MDPGRPGSNNSMINQQDWSALLAASQPSQIDTLSDLNISQNSQIAALNRQYLGLQLEGLQANQVQIPYAASHAARAVQSARFLQRSGSDMTASRRERRRDLLLQFPHPPESSNLSSFSSRDESSTDMTRPELERLKFTIKQLFDQVNQIHEALQKLTPILQKLLANQQQELSPERTQAILEQLLPHIEANLSKHLHIVQNNVLKNIETSVQNQEIKYQQLQEQVNVLKVGNARRDQEVIAMLSQLGDLMNQKEAHFDQKMEEMKNAMEKRLSLLEEKLVGQKDASQDTQKA